MYDKCKNSFKLHYVLCVMIISSGACLSGCRDKKTAFQEKIEEVVAGKRSMMVRLECVKHAEIRPGEFLAYKSVATVIDPELEKALPLEIMKDREEISEMVIPWKNNEIRWKGVDIPVSLRAYQDTLYMIGFDRETDFDKTIFRYYKQTENQFKEIKPGEYPKTIATQNLWFSKRQQEDGRVNLAINLDPNEDWFSRSLTAIIWCQLMTGKEYYEIVEGVPTEDVRKVAEEYIAKYKPVKLTKIIYEEEVKQEQPPTTPTE